MHCIVNEIKHNDVAKIVCNFYCQQMMSIIKTTKTIAPLTFFPYETEDKSNTKSKRNETIYAIILLLFFLLPVECVKKTQKQYMICDTK